MTACSKTSSWNDEDILLDLQKVISLLQFLHVFNLLKPLGLVDIIWVMFWNRFLLDPVAAEFVCFLTFDL